MSLNECAELLVTSCLGRQLTSAVSESRGSQSRRDISTLSALSAGLGRKTQCALTYFVSLRVLLLMGWSNEILQRSPDPANLLPHANSRFLCERDRSMITSPRSHVGDQAALQLDQPTTSQPLSSETHQRDKTARMTWHT